MIAEKFLKLLVCPETRLPLGEADAALLGKLNGAVAKRRLKNKGGRVLETPIEGALVRSDGAVVYLVSDNIPMLLVDEGIPLAQLD